MIKKIFICIVILLANYSFAEDFKIVHLKGEIFSITKQRNLKLGDLVSRVERLKFDKESVNCILFSGTKKMTFKTDLQKSEGQMDELFSLIPSRSLIGSRGEKDSTYLKLSDYFVNSSYLLIDSVEIIYLNKSHNQNLQNCKFIAVDSDQKKSIIPFENYGLTISRDAFFTKENLEEKVIVFLLNQIDGQHSKELEVRLIRVDYKKLKLEIESILSMLIDVEDVIEKKGLVYNLIVDIYGGVNFKLFSNFLDSNFDL